MFSGGSYDEVARWLANFLASHAKREDPRVEVALDTGGERAGRSYGARLRLGQRLSAPIDLDYLAVAARRGSLAWCQSLADRTRALARELSVDAGATDPAARR